jgi:polyhydroxybutyrate depolymerase
MARALLWVFLGSLGVAIVAVGFLLVVVPFPGDAPDFPGTFGAGTVSIDGIEREYQYYEPTRLPAGSPLVFVIHGSGMDVRSTRWFTDYGFERLADRDGFLVIFPVGFELEWNGCRSPGVSEADRRNLNDVGMITSLIDRFAASHRVDPSRVYAVGFSNGGQMAYRLGSDAPHRFAAVAAVIAHVPEPENSDCNEPRGPVSVAIMSGTDDPIIPFDGGVASFFFGISARGRVQSAAASADHWKKVNGLRGAAQIERLPDTNGADGGRVERHTWREPGRREVVLYVVHGGGHSIPGGRGLRFPSVTGPLVGFVNQDIRAPEEIWTFFQRHRLDMPPASPSPGVELR